MSDQQLLLLFLGIIAMCMFIITVGIIFAIIKYAKTMNKVDTFIALGQDEISTLSSNLSVITKDSSDLLKKVGEESQFLTFRASSGITNLTNATFAFKTLSQFFKKNPEIKEDNMKNNNLLSFTLGVAITGIGAYYVYKNKDDISKKINALEETLTDDYGELVNKAKENLEGLVKKFQDTAKEFLHDGTVDELKENEIKLLVKKLEKLQKEIEALGVKS
jgi:predicted PurR-regulated permease PerM